MCLSPVTVHRSSHQTQDTLLVGTRYLWILMLRFLGLCILSQPLLCGCSDPVLLGFRVSSGLPQPDSAFFLTAHRDSLASKLVSQAELLARTGRLEDAALAYEHA